VKPHLAHLTSIAAVIIVVIRQIETHFQTLSSFAKGSPSHARARFARRRADVSPGAMSTLWSAPEPARVAAGAAGDPPAGASGDSPPGAPAPFSAAPSSRSALGHVGRVDAWRDRGFASAAEHRAHRKSDLHRHNLRRAASGRAEVTEEEFAEALARGGGDDVSSISGSDDDDSSDDDDDDDDGAPDHPSRLAPSPAAYRAVHGAAEGPQVVCFPAPDPRADSSATSPAPPPYAVWRCVLEPQQSARGGASSDSSATRLRSALLRLRADPSKPWVVILSRGGHFAGAAFEPARFGDAFPREGEGDRGRSGASRAIGGSRGGDVIAPSNAVVAHKTFHRYVVRAKAGGRQSVKDQGGGKTIKSAGSSMRRQNELALRNEVLKTLAEWRGVLRDAALIFVAASKTDASTIFDEKSGSPICADDPRVRRVPFATKRPTFAETRRVVARLAGVNLRVRAVDDGSEKDKSPGETTLEPFQTQKGKKKDVSGKEEAASDTDASEAARAEGNGLTPAQAARMDAIAARAARAASALETSKNAETEVPSVSNLALEDHRAEGSQEGRAVPHPSKKEKEKAKKRRAKERKKAEEEEEERARSEAEVRGGRGGEEADARAPNEGSRRAGPGATKGGKAAALLARAREKDAGKKSDAAVRTARKTFRRPPFLLGDSSFSPSPSPPPPPRAKNVLSFG
jgi:hypothetical protein